MEIASTWVLHVSYYNGFRRAPKEWDKQGSRTEPCEGKTRGPGDHRCGVQIGVIGFIGSARSDKDAKPTE
jgi:hypothetical protein